MSKFKWTNESVARFAAGADPIAAMEARARELALRATDEGWEGPPFDPLALAEILRIPTEARGDIPDARTVPTRDGSFKLEYNPLRPRGRLRFSIAHEIAHTLFPDCSDAIRNRGGDKALARDDWQLEVLCNIGAAELLMPVGSFSEIADQQASIDNVLKLRKKFDVSVEACLLRLVKLSKRPIAAFCASMHESEYKVDYVISAPGWELPIAIGTRLPKETLLKDVSAIGFTTKGEEIWAGISLCVECVGLAPYPGQLVPRAVGFIHPSDKGQALDRPILDELQGDALKARSGDGPTILAHVVPNTTTAWGGNGFASLVRRKFPGVWRNYRLGISATSPPKLGTVAWDEMPNGMVIAHMVAQAGIGATTGQRLRYAALAECLKVVREEAKKRGASVQMPRIGTGHGGAKWELTKELVLDELVNHGVKTTVYQLPST